MFKIIFLTWSWNKKQYLVTLIKQLFLSFPFCHFLVQQSYNLQLRSKIQEFRKFETVGLLQISTHSSQQVKSISKLSQGLVFTRLLLVACFFIPIPLEANFNLQKVCFTRLYYIYVEQYDIRVSIPLEDKGRRASLQTEHIHTVASTCTEEERRWWGGLLSMLQKLRRREK